jgi:hypothetical protein
LAHIELLINIIIISEFEIKCFSFCTFKDCLYKLCLIDVTGKFRYAEFEDTKGIIRIRILKKNRQHNGQKKKDKRTNNDVQNIHIKLKIE